MNEIIVRILTKTNSYEDIIEFAQWLNSDKEHKEEFERIERYWNTHTRCEININTEESFRKLQMKIEKTNKRLREKKMMLYSGIAASLLVILVMAFWMKTNVPQEMSRQYTCMTEGSVSTFYMDDSTKVILNKNSEISYTNHYGQGERRVKLIGEAYFEVTKNEASPFVVDMDGATVKVLGTKFSATNRKCSDFVGALLLEGAVRFDSKEQSVLMKPNQKLLFKRSNKNLELVEVDSEQEIAWKDGLFKYRSLSFNLLMKQLEADYGVKIFIKNKQLFNTELRFTGSFEQNISFENVLDVINRTIKIKWKEKNGIYYIY